MRRILVPILILLGCGAASATLAATGTVLRDDKLYTQPRATASVADKVARGASVTILAKQGGWLRVSRGKTTGWIRLLSVRAGEGGLAAVGVGDVVGAATTRSDPSRVVAVAGLRGLNDEMLKQAKYSADELARMEGLGVTPAQADSFASQSGLAAIKLQALPKPEPEQPASRWGEN